MRSYGVGLDGVLHAVTDEIPENGLRLIWRGLVDMRACNDRASGSTTEVIQLNIHIDLNLGS